MCFCYFVILLTNSVTKNQMNELKSFARPPKLVQHTLQAVLQLIGHDPSHTKSWSEIKNIVAFALTPDQVDHKNDNSHQQSGSGRKKSVRNAGHLLEDIIALTPGMIAPEVALEVQRDYLSDEDITEEHVERASSACSALFKWAVVMSVSNMALRVRLRGL